MEHLTNVVRECRAQPVTFELEDGSEVEIAPPTIAQTLACVRLDPKLDKSETEAEKVVRFARQAKVLLGPDHAYLFEQLQPLQVSEIVGALYVAASGLPAAAFVLWQQQQRKAGIVVTALELRENLEKLSIELSARLSKMPAEVDGMPVADAVALRQRIIEVEKAKAEIQATIARVKLEWKQ